MRRSSASPSRVALVAALATGLVTVLVGCAPGTPTTSAPTSESASAPANGAVPGSTDVQPVLAAPAAAASRAGAGSPAATPAASPAASAPAATAQKSTAKASSPAAGSARTPAGAASPPAEASPSAGAAPAGSSLEFPIRAAFYYPWFPLAWRQGGVYPYTDFHPLAGFYDGGDAAVVDRQIRQLQYAGMQAAIASWWGVGSREDRRIPLLLRRSRGTGLRWSLYYERESTADPTPAQLSADLGYLAQHYASDPAFLRVGGRPVLFVYADGADACAMAQRWKAADRHGFFVVLKVFSGYRGCSAQPDGWHQYAPAVRVDVQRGVSASVSPGFHLVGQPERLSRDVAAFRAAATTVATSGAPWQLVTTFNEWGEGTAVEPAQEWSSASGFGTYLDVLHEVFTAHPPR